MSHPDVLFIPYSDTLDLLSTADALRICEEVFHMHARDTVRFPEPPSLKLDVGAPFHNHWHVKPTVLEEIPVSGLRLYNYFNDGSRNTVGSLDCTRYIILSDATTGHALSIVDEHWSYAVRSAAAAVVPCKWMACENPRVLGMVGVGTMAINSLRCLLTMYSFDEVRVTSRSAATREVFAKEWSEKLGVEIRPVDTPQAAAEGADIVVGATTATVPICRAEWLKPGVTFISLARRELDPQDWRKMDKVVIDDWGLNYAQPWFREMIDSGQYPRESLHGHIHDLVAGAVPGRQRADERILIHTAGLVSQDVAICHYIYEQAREKGIGISLPAARPV